MGVWGGDFQFNGDGKICVRKIVLYISIYIQGYVFKGGNFKIVGV